MMKKTFRIADMHCANCALKIESLEDDLPGAKRISASYHKGRMEIEYDETRLSEEQIIEAVKGKGYIALLD